MPIQKNISLKPFNTFGISTIAENFVVVSTIQELKAFLKNTPTFLILSGGSNILFTQETIPWVVHLNLKGISIVKQTGKEVLLKVAAGENWHSFVLWCIHQNFGGLENLSLIPGNVGPSPIQNIGAYGVEVKDVITEVETIEIATLKTHIFSNEDCNFGYRNSIFKNELKGKHIITSVTFSLKTVDHILNTNYGAIQDELIKKHIKNPTIKDISDVVIFIRNSKLPNPEEIGNSGSFFKNPVISKSHFQKLHAQFSKMPHYRISASEVKIPAGWLIEHAGYKGYRKGDAGVHKNQALVLVNYGNATGKEVLALATKIQETIKNTFEITLEIEINII